MGDLGAPGAEYIGPDKLKAYTDIIERMVEKYDVDREEILEKGRRENMIRDEGVEDARNKGMHWGVVGFLFLCVAVLAYNLARGLDSSLPVAFLLGYIGCEAFGRYGARRERSMLVTGILGAVGALCAVTLYVANTL